jgi:type I restriction enzyme S subunit
VQIPKGTVHEIVPMSALQVNSMILDSAAIEYGISKSGSKFTNGDTLLARITPCLENGKTAFVGNLKSSCGASGSTEFIVMRSKKLNPYMVYLIARTPDFREAAIKSMSGADGRQRAKEDVLKNIPYRLPSEGLIKKFGDVVGPMINRAYLLQSQIESLTEAQDRLLPKLMSGEIEV